MDVAGPPYPQLLLFGFTPKITVEVCDNVFVRGGLHNTVEPLGANHKRIKVPNLCGEEFDVVVVDRHLLYGDFSMVGRIVSHKNLSSRSDAI